MKISVISGTFRVVHCGHYQIMREAMRFSDKLIVCLESGEAEQHSLEKRHELLDRLLYYLANTMCDATKTYQIFELREFGEDGKKAWQPEEYDSYIFYTADELTSEQLEKLKELELEVRNFPRKTFSYCINHEIQMVSSATDIIHAHEVAGIPIDIDLAFHQLYPWR